MATQWIVGKISDAIQPTVQSAVGIAGSYAGGAINSVGTSINGVGERINTSIRYYGDGTKDYGNSVMDWTKAPAPRAQTTSNPLGLSQSTLSGKKLATNPSIYRAAPRPKPKPLPSINATPRQLTSKPLTGKKEIKPAQKKLPQAKPGGVKPVAVSGNKAIQSSTPKKTISPESRPKAVSKTNSTAGVKHTGPAMTNPLGLKQGSK